MQPCCMILAMAPHSWTLTRAFLRIWIIAAVRIAIVLTGCLCEQNVSYSTESRTFDDFQKGGASYRHMVGTDWQTDMLGSRYRQTV